MGAFGRGSIVDKDSGASGLLPPSPEGAPLNLALDAHCCWWAVIAAADGEPGSSCGVIRRWRWYAALL